MEVNKDKSVFVHATDRQTDILIATEKRTDRLTNRRSGLMGRCLVNKYRDRWTH